MFVKHFYHGVDIVNINRQEFNNIKLVKRILSSNEYDEYLKLNDFNKQRFIASRWAIKESLFKAINLKIGFNKIEVFHSSYKPMIKINNKLIKNIVISVSYEDQYVLASIILNKKIKIKN